MPRQRDVRPSDGRPKSTRTRERILDAAAEVLDRHGYAGTRLSDIAEVAEVQAPALYYYFSSRDDLIEQVVTAGQQQTIDHVTARMTALDPATPALERLDVAVAAHLESVLATSRYTSAAIRATAQIPAGMRERQLVGQREYARLWRDLVEAVVTTHAPDAGIDPGAARMLILGAISWAPQWWNPDAGSLETVVATTQAIVRRGLRRSGAGEDTGQAG